MSEAIGQALDANPNLNAAAARLDAAWAQARMAGAEQLPQIALSSGLSMSQMNMAQFGVSLPNMPSKFDSQRHNLTLGAQWEIDMWSRVRSGKRAARSGALGQAADFAGARHSLAGQVAKAWMLVIEARQQERLARFTVTTYETTVERIRARFEQGVRSSLDLRLAEASLAGAKANVAERITAANRATRQLEVLLGRIPANELTIPAELPSMPAVPASVPAKLLARRPDLVAAEHRLNAAGANVSQAKASLYPQISLTASTGTSTSDLSNLVSGDSLIWTVGANLMQPVFQGGRLRQNVKMQRANFKAMESGFRSAVLNALSEVENAFRCRAHLAVMDESLARPTSSRRRRRKSRWSGTIAAWKTSSPCLKRGGARSMPRAAGGRCAGCDWITESICTSPLGVVLNRSRNMESSTKPNRLLRIGLTIGVLAVGVVGSMLTIKFKTKAESKPSERKLPSVGWSRPNQDTHVSDSLAGLRPSPLDHPAGQRGQW